MKKQKGEKDMKKLIAMLLALTMLVNFSTEYLYQRLVVFGRSLDTAK